MSRSITNRNTLKNRRINFVVEASCDSKPAEIKKILKYQIKKVMASLKEKPQQRKRRPLQSNVLTIRNNKPLEN